MGPTHRGSARGFLEKLAALMRRDKAELCALEILEAGKNWTEADADVAEAIDFCNFYAVVMRRFGIATQDPKGGRRDQLSALAAARGGCRYRPVELSAGDSHRDDNGGDCCRQHRDHEAIRSNAGHRCATDGLVHRGRIAGGRGQSVDGPGGTRWRAPGWASSASISLRSPVPRKSGLRFGKPPAAPCPVRRT